MLRKMLLDGKAFLKIFLKIKLNLPIISFLQQIFFFYCKELIFLKFRIKLSLINNQLLSICNKYNFAINKYIFEIVKKFMKIYNRYILLKFFFEYFLNYFN